MREDVRQEWAAELHVLAEEHRHLRMLRFAASLAMARPARRSVPIGALVGGAWRVARLVLVAPLIAMALLAVSIVAMSLVVDQLGMTSFAMDLQLPLATLFTLCCAVLLAWLGRRWTVAGAPTALLLLAVTVPGFAVGVLANGLLGNSHKMSVHAPAYALFFLGLGAVLVRVARLARAGRGRAAWWTGMLGAVLVADVAVMLPVLRSTGDDMPHPASAPVWLLTALTDSGFGLPSPSGMEIFVIGDIVEFDPLLYLTFTALALGTVIAGARQVVAKGEEAAEHGDLNPSP